MTEAVQWEEATPPRRVPSARGIHQRYNGTLHVSARVDYAMRALCELAAAQAADPQRLLKSETIYLTHQVPTKFLENILRTLRSAGIVRSHRGADGGFRLARPAADISVAEVIRVLDGPLVSVRGQAPESLAYAGPAAAVQDVWVAARAAVRDVLEQVTLADLVAGSLPDHVRSLLTSPEAWQRR